jgi:hypothetical protein
MSEALTLQYHLLLDAHFLAPKACGISRSDSASCVSCKPRLYRKQGRTSLDELALLDVDRFDRAASRRMYGRSTTR